MPPLDVARRCCQLGLSPIFLTDHEGIGGAQLLLEAGDAAIIGQEILTTEGELIGLFLKKPVPSRLIPEELRATLGVPAGAGSDAHTLREIGGVFVEMEAFDGADDFLVKLRTGRVVTPHNRWITAAKRLIPRSGR